MNIFAFWKEKWTKQDLGVYLPRDLQVIEQCFLSLEYQAPAQLIQLYSLFDGKAEMLDKPDIRGMLSEIEVGYIAFVENSELTLECFSYGQEFFPEHRDQEFVRDAT
jgi:hypothetical protein